MPGPLPKPPHRRQRRNKRREIRVDPPPACVVCGGFPAPLCSPRCAARLEELGGAAQAAEDCEDEARRAGSMAEANAWRDLAAQLRAIS